jgi:predicted amidohydrolase YtcJ
MVESQFVTRPVIRQVRILILSTDQLASNGHAKGVFIDNAQDLIKKPPITEHDLIKRFNRTIRDAVASGLTSLHDAGFDPMSLKFFKRFVSLFFYDTA